MPTSCYTCDVENAAGRMPPRDRIASDDYWRVAHATGSALSGWLVLVPRRHVMELADLTDPEAASLGDWQVRLARALRAELGVAKTYVMELGELPGFHLHFHVVPRLADLAPEFRGPGVFGLLGRGPDGEIPAIDRDAFAARLATRLTG